MVFFSCMKTNPICTLCLHELLAGGCCNKITKLVGVDQAEVSILLLEGKVMVLHPNREINECMGN